VIYYNLCFIQKDILQLGKKRDVLPLKMPENSGTNMSVEQLLKEKVLEEYKLREMQREEESYQPTGDEVFVWMLLLTRVDILSLLNLLAPEFGI
jgi:hypothetical protein